MGAAATGAALESVVAAFSEARRRERERLAKIIHDELSQLLTATGLELDLLKLDIKETQPDTAIKLAASQDSLERVFTRLRELSREVDPDPVGRFGYTQAVQKLVERVRPNLSSDIDVRHCDGAPSQARAFYTVLECALDNIVRHAHCRKATVATRREGQLWRLEVTDDGVGFDTETVNRGTGLLLMLFNATKEKLDLKIRTALGRGTIIQLTSRMP